MTDSPTVSLIVAAYDERDVIAAKVANALALDYPRDRLEVIVACDGSPDATPQRRARRRRRRRARAAARRQGPAQDAGGAARRAARSSPSATPTRSGSPTRCARSSRRSRDARGRLRLRAASPSSTRRHQPGGRSTGATRCSLRALESELASVTGGNGAIYAARREAYVEVDPMMGHDLSFPFQMVKRGWRALYAADAARPRRWSRRSRASAARKRRMMSHGWPIVLHGGLLDPRGYWPLYAMMIASHRLLRYATPFLHAALLSSRVALARARPPLRGRRSPRSCCSSARPRSRARARAAAARRALLRADDRRARRSASSTSCATPTEAGWELAGGNALTKPEPLRRTLADLGGIGTLLAAPLVALASARDAASSRPATRSTRSAASARTARRSRSSSCARW